MKKPIKVRKHLKTPRTVLSVRVTQDQKEFIVANGGAEFISMLIDEAKIKASAIRGESSDEPK